MIDIDKMTQDQLNTEDRKNMLGIHNTGIRYYFYLVKGLDILNNFRNLFLGIAALYIALKLDNIFWAVIMFAISGILLIMAGWYNVHKVSKRHEWIGMRFSTHYGIRNFNYVEEQFKLMVEIRDMLKELKK